MRDNINEKSIDEIMEHFRRYDNQVPSWQAGRRLCDEVDRLRIRCDIYSKTLNQIDDYMEYSYSMDGREVSQKILALLDDMSTKLEQAVKEKK